ncbi:MAG: DUF1573 domain-containing protein [Bacteroidales bacterium]|nr:DUF1573 domain-containing protein [Bacteroidales bacterium]
MYRRFYSLLVLVILLPLTLVSCSKKENKISAELIENSTSINFEKDFIDLGRLTSGEIVTCSFKFKNTGKYDLIISAVTANCGCTVADFPREPISPNQEGQITVRYDSEGSAGIRISKEVSVLSNTSPATTTLRIAADVN